jgi:prevent-host-death family protein
MVSAMKKVPLTELKDDLSSYLRMAEKEEIIITRHGRPAGILVGFASEEEWFDYQLENDPRFLKKGLHALEKVCGRAKVSSSRIYQGHCAAEQTDELERR